MYANVRHSGPASEAIKGNGSILALSDEQTIHLTDAERDNIRGFQDRARRYPHRMVVPLDEDRFKDVREALDAHNLLFARVPFPSINTVIYLFRDREAVRVFLSVTEDIQVPGMELALAN